MSYIRGEGGEGGVNSVGNQLNVHAVNYSTFWGREPGSARHHVSIVASHSYFSSQISTRE